jgi:hypothetical protein
MPTLVLPDRTIQRIPDKNSLNEWAVSASIPRKLTKNLSQLLGFDPAPTEGKTAGRSREGHFLLQDTTWMYHADWLAALPLFGPYPAKYNQLKETASVGFSVSTFKRLHDNGGLPSEDGWWVGSEPAGVFTLSNGSTLFDVPLTPSSGPATAIPAPGALLDLGALSVLTSSVAETTSRLIASPEVSLGAFVGIFSRSSR